MRILFVTPYVPSRVRIRPYAFIRELAARGHEISLVCLVQPAHEACYLDEIRPYCTGIYPVTIERVQPYVRTLFALPSREPLAVAYCRSQNAIHQVEELVGKHAYDLVHTEFIRAAPFTRNLRGMAKVFDAVDSMALAHQRSLRAANVTMLQRATSLLEWTRVRHYESSVLRDYHYLLASSPVDLEVMQQVCALPASVVPNGVDTEFFQFSSHDRQEDEIIFLGKMSYYVNVASVLWFYHQVFPLVKQQRPKAHFTIIGRDPAPRILALSSDPSVTVTGTLEDVRPHLARATISVCPMISGAGIQNKMLEAMSMGIPTVATSIASLALQVTHGEHLMIADQPDLFASAVVDLLQDPAKRAHLAASGRSYVESQHNWKAIGKQLENIYNQVIY